MSPLIKSPLTKKSRLSCNNKDQLATINRRISGLICEIEQKINIENEHMKIENEHLAAPVGSVGWWKTVNDITQRCTHSNSLVLDNTFANQLNDYFRELCPDLMRLSGAKNEVPEIPERLVWKSISNITRTATGSDGPDGTPFWVWKEHAEILIPILSNIWKICLCARTPGLCHGKNRISIRYPRLTYPKKSLTTVV